MIPHRVPVLPPAEEGILRVRHQADSITSARYWGLPVRGQKKQNAFWNTVPYADVLACLAIDFQRMPCLPTENTSFHHRHPRATFKYFVEVEHFARHVLVYLSARRCSHRAPVLN